MSTLQLVPEPEPDPESPENSTVSLPPMAAAANDDDEVIEVDSDSDEDEDRPTEKPASKPCPKIVRPSRPQSESDINLPPNWQQHSIPKWMRKDMPEGTEHLDLYFFNLKSGVSQYHPPAPHQSEDAATSAPVNINKEKRCALGGGLGQFFHSRRDPLRTLDEFMEAEEPERTGDADPTAMDDVEDLSATEKLQRQVFTALLPEKLTAPVIKKKAQALGINTTKLLKA